MDRKGESVLEDLRGVGEVFRGSEPLCRVQYSIEVIQEWVEPAPSYERVVERNRVKGWVQPIGKPMTELLDAENLRLQIEDGRQMSFLVSGTDGTIVHKSGTA